MPKIAASKLNATIGFFMIGLAYASLFSLGVIDNMRGPFLPEIIQDLNLTGTTSSLFFSLTSLFSCFGSALSPLFLQRRTSLQLLMYSGGLLAFGFSLVGWAQNLPVLLLGASLVGITFGTLGLTHNILIHEFASPQMRRRLYSGLHGMYGLAALAAPIFAMGFRELEINWRQSFLIVSALPILVAVTAFPKRGYVHQGEELLEKPKLNRREYISVFLFAFILACYLIGEISATTRLVLWLRTERGFTPDKADMYLAIFCGLLLLGRVICTFYHLPWRNVWVLRVSAFVSAVFYAMGLIYSPIWLLLSGGAMAPFYPVAMDYVIEEFGRKSSSALSLILGLSSLSIVMMHMCIGMITDFSNLTYGLSVGPAGLFLICALFWPWLFASHRVTKK